MSNQPSNPLNGERVCPRCGAHFTCGMAAGEGRCWCFDLPRVLPVPGEAGTDCLCPACLRQIIAAHHQLDPTKGQ